MFVIHTKKQPLDISRLVAIATFIKKIFFWPLFMDGVQLPKGYSHFEKAVYFLPLSYIIRSYPVLWYFLKKL